MNNKPIIDPMWFYYMGIGDTLKGWLIFFAVIAAIFVIILNVILFSETTEVTDETKEKILIPSIIFDITLIIMVFSSILVPSSDTVKQMMIASSITPNNITIIKSTIKDTAVAGKDMLIEIIDHITDKNKVVENTSK